MLEYKVLTKNRFCSIIETIVKETRCSYMDAVLTYCDDNNMEQERAAKLLTPKIKKDIEVEADRLNFLTST